MKMYFLLILRRFYRHPWQFFLSVLGISLGVSIVLAIDLTNTSAQRAFRIANQSITKEYNYQIIGGTEGLDESLYGELRTTQGLHRLIPIVEGEIKRDSGENYRIIGIDPIALMGRSQAGVPAVISDSLFRLISEPGSAIVTEETRINLQTEVPGQVLVLADGRPYPINIIETLPARSDIWGQLLQSSFLTDIVTAQDILGMQGRLSRIDAALSPADVVPVKEYLGQSAELIHSETPGKVTEQMTRAFRINLTALSLLALVIGAFLIYNTMTISVLQRRDQFSILRTLGYKHSEIFFMVMSEALIVAVLGILLGYGFGIGLSKYLIQLSSRTMTDLYFVREVQDVYLSVWSFTKATLLGLGGALSAAYLPARDAMVVVPTLTRSRSFLELQTVSRHGILFIYSVLSGCVAVIILLVTEHSIIAGFAALFFIIMSFALMSPSLLVCLIRILAPVIERLIGLLGCMATRGVLASLSRTQIAVAALAVSVSATIGVSIMISSFRYSVEIWLLNYLRADVFISSSESDRGYSINDSLLKQIESLQGLTKITTSQYRNLWQDENLTRLRIVGIDAEVLHDYPFKDTNHSYRWLKFSTDNAVVISEPYAYHHNLHTGDLISLPTGTEDQQFEVVGIYVDYGSDQGVITMHRDIYERYWDDPGVASLSLYIDENHNAESFAKFLNISVLPDTKLHARANRDLRNLSLEIFDRTFSITEVLRIITIIIAVIGIFGALMAIHLERNREFAILRANGLTPYDLNKLILVESGLMGISAGIIAIPLGVVLAAVLIFIINRRSFGWSMEFVLEPGYLVSAVLLGLFAGLLAGFYPAWRTMKISPAIALRDE